MERNLVIHPNPTAKGDGKSAKDKEAGKGSKDNKTNPKSTPCKFFTSDEGCKHGGKCSYFHPRVTRDEGKCFNCGSKSHALKECDKPKPTKREPSKDAMDAKPSKGKGRSRSSSKPQKPKPKAASATADE
eukprot:1343557-Amphidinium_carterae.1